jgi:hypothetical protein
MAPLVVRREIIRRRRSGRAGIYRAFVASAHYPDLVITGVIASWRLFRHGIPESHSLSPSPEANEMARTQSALGAYRLPRFHGIEPGRSESIHDTGRRAETPCRRGGCATTLTRSTIWHLKSGVYRTMRVRAWSVPFALEPLEPLVTLVFNVRLIWRTESAPM